MAQIITPPQSAPQPRAADKPDFWDKLNAGLSVAQTGLGIAVNWQKLKEIRDQNNPEAVAAREQQIAMEDESRRLALEKQRYEAAQRAKPIEERDSYKTEQAKLAQREESQVRVANRKKVEEAAGLTNAALNNIDA